MNSDFTDFALDGLSSAAPDSSQYNAVREERMNAVEALKYIDGHWYKEIGGKQARWMDLIGDYAGNERFILDGDECPFFRGG
jgi:ATP-dependent RNA helicase DDX60